MYLYRRWLGVTMIVLGVLVYGGQSLAVDYVTDHVLASFTFYLSAALMLCGTAIQFAPQTRLFIPLSVPFVLFLASQFYFAEQGNGGLTAAAVSASLYGMALIEAFTNGKNGK